jgi:hypothetical protein
MIQQSTCSAATRFALLHPLVLLVAGLISWPPEWAGVRAVVEGLRSPEAGPADRDGRAVGYYVELIEGRGSGSSSVKPAGWVGFREAEVIRYLDGDFLLFELKPDVRRILFGQPFETNAYGMHDDPVARDKPDGTFRIAVLGASMDMGWGVRHQDTYTSRLQEWLNAGLASRAPEQGRPRRYEVLNFAVAAYSPLQRLETLRRKVLAFQPDLVVYSATTLDIRLMEIHLCDLLRKRVDLKYDFVREAVGRTGVGDADLAVDREGILVHKSRLKRKLQPTYWGLYDRALGAIAADCRSAGIPLAMVIIPRVGADDAPQARAEPVARLKAIAAHHAVTAFDLSDAFDGDDPATLEIAAWDDHPNATGHERLFDALSRVLAADPTLAPLLISSDRATIGQAGPERGGPRPPS